MDFYSTHKIIYKHQASSVAKVVVRENQKSFENVRKLSF